MFKVLLGPLTIRTSFVIELLVTVATTTTVGGLLLSAPAQAFGFTDVNLGKAGPSDLNLGIFVTGSKPINASNSGTTFDTNLGLSSGAGTNFSGNGTLTGKLYKDPGATVQSNIDTKFNVNGGIVTQNLVQAVSDVMNAANIASSLTANKTYTNVGSSALTINSNVGTLNALGGYNTVIGINSINITNSSNNLTISGGVNDWFIINVAQTIAVTQGQIALSGGIMANHVLFNVLGTGDSVKLSNGSSILNGTFLAPKNNQKITLAPGTVNGAIIGYQIQTSSGPTVNGQVYQAYQTVPEPLTLLGSGIALGFGTYLKRKQKPFKFLEERDVKV